MAKSEPIETAVAVVTPPEVLQTLTESIEKLLERLDQGDRNSMDMFREILDKHGEVLKGTLRPENRLHPDISWYNPEGERDHPRPRLKRPTYFLGIPCDQATLSVHEIELLNQFDGPKELKDKNWHARILRDQAGGEVLYFDIPFKNFDDLRGIGGLQEVATALLTGVTIRANADELADLRETVKELKAMLLAQQAAVLAPLPASPAAPAATV